jgi:hypothetical protein
VAKKRSKTKILVRSLIAAAITALALLLPAASASAGFFDMLFGGIRRSAPSAPPPPLPSVAPRGDPGDVDGLRAERSPSMAYCVRLCDAHPFPVQSGNVSSAQACASMCPAAKTKVFAGGGIDYAVSSDGKRYSDLPNAFLYRKQTVDNCTCNGRTVGGLVHGDAKSDPTLRPGDMIATNQGLVSYRGGSKNAEFTPVRDKQLAHVKIRPAPVSKAALAANARAEEPPPNVDEPTGKKSGRRAQR